MPQPMNAPPSGPDASATPVGRPLPTGETTAIIEKLPVAPRILAELAPRLQQNDVDIRDVARLIRRDAGITARLIAAANSAAYAAAEPSASLEDAVARIGYRETFRILGAVAAAQLADEPLRVYRMHPRRLRENAVFAALVMEELATGADIDPRAAYTTGLLRSVGKVVLDRLATTNEEFPVYDVESLPLGQWELIHLGYSNPEVAAYVLQSWRFPAKTVAAVLGQYAPPEDSPPEVHLLNLASGAAHARDLGFPGEQSYWVTGAARVSANGIDPEQLKRAADRAGRTLSRISAALA
jgi:HD-like signal output (HDOD) protein